MSHFGWRRLETWLGRAQLVSAVGDTLSVGASVVEVPCGFAVLTRDAGETAFEAVRQMRADAPGARGRRHDPRSPEYADEWTGWDAEHDAWFDEIDPDSAIDV